MKKDDFKKALEQIQDKRKFKQSYELIINLKGLNLKKPEEQVDIWLQLPNKIEEKKVCALVGGELKEEADNNCAKTVLVDDFNKYEGNKKEIKKLSQSYDFFIAQANIMPTVAKTFGRYFGPHGKMPNPKVGCVVPPNASLGPLVEKLQTTARAAAKTEASVKLKAGKEEMDLDKVAENMLFVYNTVLHKLPQEKNNIKNVIVKTTMSAPIRVEEGK